MHFPTKGGLQSSLLHTPTLCLDNGSCGGLEQGSVALGVGRQMSENRSHDVRDLPPRGGAVPQLPAYHSAGLWTDW